MAQATVKVSQEYEIAIRLDLTEAMWLMAMMQNPITGDTVEAGVREAIFNALKEAGVRA